MPVIMPANADSPRCPAHQARCAPRRAQWRGAFRLCVLSVATSMQHVGALVVGNLRSSSNQSQNPTDPAAVAKEYFLLERVGFQAGGAAEQPRSPNYAAATCLTSGGPDQKGGIALGWRQCQDRTVLVNRDYDFDLLEAQAFQLNADGTLRNKKHGLCVRRLACHEASGPGPGLLKGYLYDLGTCGSETDVKLKVQKAQANNVAHLRDMGTLSHAVALELCSLCGPYNVQNMCLGGSRTGCGDSYQGKPGWTKLASQYIGYNAVHGHSEYGGSGAGDSSKYEHWGIDMAGIGPTKQGQGLCGSYATDAPAISSYFYILKADFKKK